MLFNKEDIEFDGKVKTNLNYDQFADNVNNIKKVLSEKYNLQLVYIIIPNKYSIYRDILPEQKSYINFIPLITEKLKKRNVKTEDLYSIFIEYRKKFPDKLLYYGSDTHFNEIGQEIFINVIQNLISSTTIN
jgi:hypothetical protein